MVFRSTLLTALLFLLSQCTVERRLYNKGLHIEWHKNQISAQDETIRTLTSPDEVTTPIPGKTQIFSTEKENEVMLPAVAAFQRADNIPEKDFGPGEFLASQPPPNDDTIYVSADQLGGKTSVSDKEVRTYNIAWILVTLALLGLIVLCILAVASITVESSLLGLFGLLVLIPVLLVAEIVFAVNHPYRKFERRLENAVKEQQEAKEMESSPERKEEILEDKRRKKTKAAIFFGVLMGVVLGGIIYFEHFQK